MKNVILLLLFIAAGNAAPAADEAQWAVAKSPDGQTELAIGLRAGQPVYKVARHGTAVLEPSALMLELAEPFTGGFSMESITPTSANTSWKPTYGEREVYQDNYRGLTLKLAEQGKAARHLAIEARATNEGVALRYVFPAGHWKIKRENTEFRFVADSKAYPIYSAEETFSKPPIAIGSMKAGAQTPLTLQLPGGFASLLEADCADYSRLRIGKTPDGALVSALTGAVESTEPFTSPWRVILLGDSEKQLIENENLVQTLNPPCALADTGWIAPGKTISNEGSAPLVGRDLKRIIDFAAPLGFKYLQLDWGWYGTEWKWTDEDREIFRKTMPAYASRTDWIANTNADPFKVAQGPVPYRRDWKGMTTVDLDLPDLIRYGREHGMGICLYVEAQRTLRAVDMDKLFATYESWGVAGLKPGFVRVGSQENTRWIRQMIATAAKHHLWLCIHDGHLPDGAERTWPNLFICEAGGGQEGNHPAIHDVTLPFTRCLAGPFDYTPMLYSKGKTHAHMLAFLVAYYGPAQTIRGGYRAWTSGTGPGKGGAEAEFLKRVPTTWDNTRVLDARIAQRIVVARRSGKTWFIGGMTGAEAQTSQVKLDFLTPGRGYTATIFRDDPAAANGDWCPTKRETQRVTSADTLSLPMEKAGGCVVMLDPEV